MSGPSPARVRTKASDFTQFFRSQSSRHSSHREPAEDPALLDVPEESDCITPKKTKLPFLSRTRKKSTHSVKSGVLPSTGRGYESEAADPPSLKKESRRLSQPVAPEPIKQPPLPAPSAIPHISVSSPSLGSKFAARFGSSRLRKAASSPRSPALPASNDGNTTDTLSPPTDARAASFDSTTTTTSTIPSAAPDGPVITLTSDNLEDYKDLFTLPRSKEIAPKRQLTTPASEYRDNYHKTESAVTLTPSSPSSPRMDPPVPDTRVSSPSRNEAKERVARRLAEGSRSSKIAKKRAPGPRPAEDSTPEHSADESVLQLRAADLTPVIDVTPPPQSSRLSSPTPRTRMRAPSVMKETRASTPPSIPLPAPPTKSSGSPTTPTPPPSSPKLAPPPANVSTLTRPRANTIGAVPVISTTATTLTRASSPKPSIKLTTDNSHGVKQSLNKENADLDAVTVKQLKEALVQRNQQYAELATHFLEVTKGHATEKAALEKKIASLEAEVARKDKEIQGFTWMLNNRGTQPPTDNGVDYTRIPGPRVQRSPSTASSKVSSRHIQQAEDSGAESPSGAESVRSSMSNRLKKGLRPLTLGESSYNIYRSSLSSKSAPSRGPAVDSNLSDQRTSVYSLSSSTSATSSSSSLLPPSPSIPVSSLSAIPEVSVVGASSKTSLPRISTSTRDSLSASEWETDVEKRHDSVHSSRRISLSSFSSSSSSAATSAYSANLKRGRPPSIAQVLQKSPTMDEVLEKLRPFAAAY